MKEPKIKKILEIKIDDDKIKKVLLYLAAFFIPFCIIIRSFGVFKSSTIWR